MKRLFNLTLAALFIAAPLLVLPACDRVVEERTKTTSKNGAVEKERKVVTEDTHGNTTVTREKTETNDR